MRMKKFMCFIILEDGDTCYKIAVSAFTEEEAREYVSGIGEIIAVKDVTEEIKIDVNTALKALEGSGFDKFEVDTVAKTLTIYLE